MTFATKVFQNKSVLYLHNNKIELFSHTLKRSTGYSHYILEFLQKRRYNSSDWEVDRVFSIHMMKYCRTVSYWRAIRSKITSLKFFSNCFVPSLIHGLYLLHITISNRYFNTVWPYDIVQPENEPNSLDNWLPLISNQMKAYSRSVKY